MPVERPPQQRPGLTPQQRLALSRRALVLELHGNDAQEQEAHELHGMGDDDAGRSRPFPRAAGRGSRASESSAARFPWASIARSLADHWWRRHPAHAVGRLARPLLAQYAQKEPAKLMAMAAATGAALVIVKPWRLLSLTAVLAAVLKTSDLADLVNTLMQQKTTNPRKDMP